MSPPPHIPLAALFAAALLGIPAPAVADRAHPFRLPEATVLGDQPCAIAYADFDHDGREDFALTVRADSTVLVYRGRADGALGVPLRYPFHGGASYTFALLAGDVDGDGWQDLVIGEAWGTAQAVHFLRNDGTGDFEPDRMMQVSLQPNTSAPGAGIGDADGDDRADVVVLGAASGSALFLRALGASGFAAPVTLSHAFGLKLAKLADVNGDGLADVVAVGANSVAVRMALGGGAWSAPVVSAIPGVAAVADQDGDGRADMWLFGETQGAVYRGVGDGTFTPPAALPGGPSGLFPFIRDLDGDGLADALLNYGTSPPTGVYMFLSAPDGSLPMRGIWGAGGNSFPAGLDYDSDGVLDLVTAARDGLGLRLSRGLGPARFHDPTVCRTGTPGRLAIADLDGDARAELLAVSPSASLYSLYVYRGSADGILPFAQRQELQPFPYALALADLDGDGGADAFVTSTDGPYASQRWLHGNGDGTFASTTPLSGEVGWSARQALAADFDGDGHTDLLTDGPSVRVAWGQGGGAFAPLASLAVLSGRLALTKLAGDAVSSLVVAKDSLRVVRSGGDRSWTVLSAQPLAAVPVDMATTQVGGDSTPDVIMAHAGAGTVEVRLALGDTFGAGTTYACGDATHLPHSLAVGDVDGDGHRDIVVSNAYVNTSIRRGIVTVWYNTGAGTFTDRVDFDPGGYMAGSCALGDVNGDGTLDLAVASGRSDGSSGEGNDVLVLLNAAAPPPLAVPAPGAPASFALARAWPNPLGREAALNLQFSLPARGDVRVELLDVQGRRLHARALGSLGPGTHAVTLKDAAGSPGLYFVRLVCGTASATRRIVRID